jgi:hypothetical protein
MELNPSWNFYFNNLKIEEIYQVIFHYINFI